MSPPRGFLSYRGCEIQHNKRCGRIRRGGRAACPQCTKSITKFLATTCSSSKWSWIPVRPLWPKPAGCFTWKTASAWRRYSATVPPSIGIAFQKRIGAGFFGGEGFIMERLDGDGWAFVHAGGMLIERTLAPGEVLRVDTGCLVALQPSIDYDIEYVGRIKSALFGVEGLFFATLRGPGRVWLQSLPLSRMARRILAAAPQTGRGGREEGSVLGTIGDIIGGDR